MFLRRAADARRRPRSSTSTAPGPTRKITKVGSASTGAAAPARASQRRRQESHHESCRHPDGLGRRASRPTCASARALLAEAARAGRRAGRAARIFLPAWAGATPTSSRCARLRRRRRDPATSWPTPRASSGCGSSAARCRWPAATPAHVRNSSLVFAPAGECVARYDKIHLFRFDNGHERYDESRVHRAGHAARDASTCHRATATAGASA